MGWGAGEGRQWTRRGERKGTFIVCDLGIPAQEPPGCTRRLRTILQQMDSCTCFNGEETAQTKRWAEGIMVPGPLAGGGSTTARGILRSNEMPAPSSGQIQRSPRPKQYS